MINPKDFVTEEIIDEIIDNSFCSDIFNDKTDVEIIKLDTVLNIVKKHLEWDGKTNDER